MHLQERLAQDVREWERRGKPKDRLYRSSQLREVQAWQQRNVTSSVEAAFLRASTARRTRTRISLVLAALLLLSVLIPAGLLFAQQLTPLTVTTLQDDRPGSLRQAIANDRWGGTILIDPHLKGALILSRDLVINKDLTIRGPGAGKVVVRGTRDFSGLIQIQSHATVTFSQLTFSDPTLAPGPIIINQGTLTLEDCQLTGNNQKGDNLPSFGTIGGGGAITNFGTLTLHRSLIAHNTVIAGTSRGGGIVSQGGTLVVNNSQIVENTVISSGQVAFGGGIYSLSSQVTLINSTITGNKVMGGSTTNGGGGIYSQQDHLTISNSTISTNSVQAGKGGYGEGGGIMSIGSTLNIDHSHLQSNRVVSSTMTGTTIVAGGALYSQNLSANNKLVAGAVTITDSVLSDNTVTGYTQIRGGGIAAITGSLTLIRAIVTHNRLTSQLQVAGGGGIYSGDTLTITDSLVSDNSATAPAKQYGALGGGIDTTGTLTLLRSTIALNIVNSSQGTAAGGGIYADRARSANARLNLANCTIANNQALGAPGIGGGFSTDTMPTSGSMDFCTIAGNVASTRAGGIDADDANTPRSALLSLKNSIFADNTAPADPDISGTFITGGYNLVQHWTGARVKDALSLHRTDLSANQSAQLGLMTQLRMNGGPTPMLALQAGSPAIDAIPASACDVATDQRGVKRPQHNACDIGSYEYS